MSLERFFIDQPPDGPIIRLERDETHHLCHVRRVKVGDEVVLFDGSGTDYFGRVLAFDRSGAAIEIVRSEKNRSEPDVAVTLAVSAVKEQHMDQLVDSCTQLGMKRLIPMLTERSVVKPGAGKTERWRRIAIEACKQSGRSVVPEIAEPCDLSAVLAGVGEYDVAVIAVARSQAKALASVLTPPPKTVLCLIGPEGGFTEDEESAAIAAGCVPVSLGKSILRTETAASTALAVILA